MTVSELLERYIRDRELQGCRVGQMRAQLRHVVRLLGSLGVEELTYLRLEEYREERRGETTQRGAPPAEASLNRELGGLRAALRLAHRQGLLESVPDVPMGRESPPRMDFATPEQAEAIESYLEEQSEVVADLFRFLWITGWRFSEAGGLRWEEVRWAEGRLVVPPQRIKTRQARIVPIAAPLAAILRRRGEERQGPLVFHRQGERFRRFPEGLWRRATAAAGCPELHVHGLRRSMARRHLLAGIPQAVTMRLAGWRTDSIYRRYAIVDEGALSEAILRDAQPQNPAESPG